MYTHYFFIGFFIYPFFSKLFHTKLNKFSNKTEKIIFYLCLSELKHKLFFYFVCIFTIFILIYFPNFSFMLEITYLTILFFDNLCYKKIKEIKYFLYSPDFYFANSAKINLTNYKNPKYKYKDNLVYDYIKSKYIIYWNSLNLCISFSLFVLCSSFINYMKFFPIDSLFTLFGFITYRVVSRASEIILAFYIDITDSKKKNTFINSNKRIVLATISYFEIIFNFATLNYLAAVLYSHICPLYKKAYPYIFTLFEDNPDKSITLNPLIIFINSFGTTTLSNATVDSFFSMLQVLTSLVLVLFALAGYLNNKGDNK